MQRGMVGRQKKALALMRQAQSCCGILWTQLVLSLQNIFFWPAGTLLRTYFPLLS